MAGTGIYVYGIVGADHPCRLDGLSGVGATGTTGAAVRRVAVGSTAAVVSAAPAELLAKRRDLLTHQRVMEALWEQAAVLPMRFGVVAPSEDRLRAELSGAQPRYLALLAEVAGRGEMNVKVFQEEEMLVERVSTDPAVRRAIGASRGNYLDQVRLGEIVATAVQRLAAADGERVLRALTPLAARVARGPQVEGCAMNLSFLVDVGWAGAFAEAVKGIGADLGLLYRIRVTGPMPPYSFTG